MDTRRMLAELLAGKKSGRPQVTEMLRPDWWQGGGPRQPPVRPEPPMMPPMSLQGRSRMDPYLPMPSTEEENSLLEEMAKRAGPKAPRMSERSESERLRPRQYGLGQSI